MKNIKKIKKLLSENRSLSTPEKEALLKEHNLTKKKYYQLLAEQDSWDILDKNEFGEPIQLWKIDKTSGDCTLSGDFEGFYICLSGEDGESVSDQMSDLSQDPFDEYTINYNHAQCCNPYDLIDGQEGLEEGDYSGLNTINNFMFFLNGGCGPIDEGVNLNYLNDPSIEGDAGGFNYYYAQDCPSCLPDEFPGAPYDVPPNVIDGNNFPTLPSNGGHDQLKFIQDGSCIVSACNQKYWDNYFCTIYPQLCGAGTNNCNGSCAVWLDTLIENVEDDDSCFYDGCTTVPSDLNYVCTLYPTLCPGTSAMMDPDTTDFQFQMYGDQSNPTNYFGIPGGYYSDTYIGPEAEENLAEWSEANVNGTFNQVEGGCVNPPSFGCTNNIFTNYNQDVDGNSTINNIDDGSCYWEGCAEPKLAYLDEYVCNTPSGAVLCPDGETYNDEYQDGLNTGLSYTATAGDAFIVDDETTCPLIEGCTNPNFIESYNPDANWDNGSCVYTGCLDNTKPNYICNAMPSLCDQQGPDGVPLQTYTGITSEGPGNEIPSDIYLYIDNPNPDFGPLVLSNPDACGEFGCMDSGEMGQEWWDANYAGQDNGGLGALPDDYPGFQPGNYNELATEDDSSCNYNLNGTTVFDFEDIEGCVQSMVDTDGGSFGTFGYYTPNLNGNVPPGATLNTNPSSCNPIVFGCMDNGTLGQEWWDGNPNNPYGLLEGTSQFNWQYQGVGPIYQNVQGYSNISYLPNEYPGVPPCEADPTNSADTDTDFQPTLGEQIKTRRKLLKEQEEPTNGGCVENYNPLANVDDGSCIYNLLIEGCVQGPDPDPTATIDISWFTLGDAYDWATNPCNHVEGCTDPDAVIGYNSNADVDDGSCIYEVEGCMEPSADNYNTIANIEDGSCVWNSEGAACVQVEGGCCGQPYATNQTQLGVDIPLTENSIYALANNGYLVGPDSMIGNMSQTLDAMVGLVYVGTTLGSDHVTNGFDSEYCIFSGFCTDPNDQDEYMCDNNSFVFLCDGFDSDSIVPNTDLGQFLDSNCTSDPIPGCMDPNANGPAGPAPYGPYNPFATTDDENALGGTYCTYSYCGHNNEQANWNAPLNFGELNPDAGPNLTNIAQWFPGTEFNKPQYQVTAGGTIYGGGTWTDDDFRDFSLCRYEGCANLAAYETVTVNGVDYNYSSDIPGEELGGLGSNIVNDFGEPLYTYNAQNDGCDPQGDGTPDLDDFSCCAIPGCTDGSGLATNYNENATISAPGGNAPSGTPQYNNGCNYLLGCTDPTMDNYDEYATIDDGSCFAYGCTTEAAGNNFADNYWCNETTTIDNFADNPDDDEIVENNCDPDIPDNILDEGPNAIYVHPETGQYTNCIFYGCTDAGYTNYDPMANVDDAGCAEEIVYGCTENGMFNYNPQANVDDGSCEEVVYGCMDPDACNTNYNANTNSGCQYPPPADAVCEEYDCNVICIQDVTIWGCTDNTACNYDPNANANYGCLYPDVGYDCDGECLNDLDEDGICDDNEEYGYENDPTNGEACYDVIAVRCDDPEEIEHEFKCMRIASNTGGNGESIYYYDPLIYTPDSAIVKEFLAPDLPEEDIDLDYDGECQWCPGFTWTDQNTGITQTFEGYWFPIGLENEDLEQYNMITPLGSTTEGTQLGNIQNFASNALCQNYKIDAFLTQDNQIAGPGSSVGAYVTNQLNSYASACEEAGYSGIGVPATTTWGDDWYNWPGGVNFYYEYTEGEVVVAENCPPSITGEVEEPGGWVHSISDIINPNTGCQTSTMGDFPSDWNCNYWSTTDNWGAGDLVSWYPVPDDYNGQTSYIEVPPNTSVMVMEDYPTYQGVPPFGPIIQGPAVVCFSGTVNVEGLNTGTDNAYGISNNWVSTFVVNPPDYTTTGMPDSFDYLDGSYDSNFETNPDLIDNYSCPNITVSYYDSSTDDYLQIEEMAANCGVYTGQGIPEDIGADDCLASSMLCDLNTGAPIPPANSYEWSIWFAVEYSLEQIISLCEGDIGQVQHGYIQYEGTEIPMCYACSPINPSTLSVCSNLDDIDDIDDVDDEEEIEGCTDPTALNYDENATIDDGSCEYADDTIDDTPDWINPNVVNVAQHCVGDPSFPGTTWEFPITTTQDEDGVLDLGPGMANEISYVWVPAGLTARFYTVPQTNTSFPGEAPLELVGPQEINCLVDLGYNDTIQAVSVFETGEDINVDDIEGCTDPNYQEYNPDANVDDGSCTTEHIFGCMDEDADNYNLFATFEEEDDCIFVGCTDFYALNYDPQANTPCSDTPGTPGDNECCEYYDPTEFQPDTAYYIRHMPGVNDCKTQADGLMFFQDVTAEDVGEVLYPLTSPSDGWGETSSEAWPNCKDTAEKCKVFTSLGNCCYQWKVAIESSTSANQQSLINQFNDSDCAISMGPIE